jgi:hypothetical protein
MCKHGASRFNDNSDHSFIGGGEKNEIRSEWNVIGGGQNNLIDVDTFGSKWSVIGGGRYNYDGEGGEYNIVVGGDSNLNNGGVSFMGGGQGNQVYNELGWATLGGGYWNFIGNIVSGRGPDYASLLGGKSDSLAADYGVIGGGQNNSIAAGSDHSAIVGGNSNQIQSDYIFSAIVAGAHNTISSAGSEPGRANFMGAGDSNLIDGNGNEHGADPAKADAIVAGIDDTVHEGLTFVGAGKHNVTWDDADFIGAGTSNLEHSGSENGIGAGRGNFINAPLAQYNDIGSSFIGAGDTNKVEDALSFIGAGAENVVGPTALESFIGSGDSNNIQSRQAFIGGGEYNQALAVLTAVSGGRDNVITFSGQNAAIPGGDSLFANSYAEAVVGYNNDTGMAVTKATAMAGVAGTSLDPPVFVVGNGKTAASRSNAFQVSYDGHSSTFDVNGTGALIGGRAAMVGSTYEDNAIVAWANVPAATGAPSPHTPVTPTADFGVSGINYSANGQFDVILNVANPDGTPYNLSGASVTVTVEDGSPTAASNCVFATSTAVGAGNKFTVHLHDTSCGTPNVAFMFKVVGR